MDLLQIEKELKKRLVYPYVWGMKQNDVYDSLTNFAYQYSDFDTFLRILNERFERKERYKVVFNYALNRWFNFWSAYALEEVFCSLPNVKPAKNKKDRLVDFEIHGINFDHKSTIYPKKFNKTIEEAQQVPVELIKWLYENQSQQKRMHNKNRLYIVLYSNNNDHWKLKADLVWLKELVTDYVSNFDPQKLYSIQFDENSKVLSDIIWAIK
jgi:hypothetical protein